MHLTINHQEIELDKEGYLKKISDWNRDIATAIAEQEQLTLTEAHWEIIELLRNFYNEYEISPAMRVLVKQTRLTLGDEKGRSIYLMGLFPPSPAKIACKIAGLPRPTNCI